ncbi:fatty acid--CoA ligase family protein [Candidatus Woesearchaeota archaeon]|nr:fatty acid--CoA ligase family protein [Candidatus Woesearchaeota archaeon]
MFIDFLTESFEKNSGKEAIIWKEESYRYEYLTKRVKEWEEEIRNEKIGKGAVVMLEADFSPNAVALFLALTEEGCIIVPLTSSVRSKKSEFTEIAQGEFSIVIDEKDNVSISRLPNSADHELYGKLRNLNHPGLVLFSSGSTGKSKAAVHDLTKILEKFKAQKRGFRSITFLLYDHIGGVNTMLHMLSNAGCIITVQDRSPDNVLRSIEKHKADLLPTTPTFINLMLLSKSYREHDLSSLKLITYGTEPMPESTLRHFHELFPNIRLLQTYGLSEVGILSSRSKDSGSLWVKVGGEGFETRVVEGILQIKARSAMLGYLNAPSPFTEDGWFNTGDSVEVDGDYIRILGRKSEIINVGGQKVYPAEVESVIQEMEEVSEVTVYGEKNVIMGNIVCADVTLNKEEKPREFSKRLREYCSKKLEDYKVPIKVRITSEDQHSERFKKIRYRPPQDKKD